MLCLGYIYLLSTDFSISLPNNEKPKEIKKHEYHIKNIDEPHKDSTRDNYKNQSISVKSFSRVDELKVLKFYDNILSKERKFTSQNKEDGVLLAILNFLKLYKPGYYVEFGTESGLEINTRHLREVYKWKGKSLKLKFKKICFNNSVYKLKDF